MGTLVLAFIATLLGTGAGLIIALKLLRKQNENSAQDRAKIDEIQSNAFKALAQESLKQSQESFLQLARERLQQEAMQQKAQLDMAKKEVEQLVKPLAENLDKYKKELAEVEAQRGKEYGSLDRMMKGVLESNEQLKRETTNLVHALKRPTVRGRWGEIQLKRIVELAGMSSYCDFTEQNTVTAQQESGDAARLRPDMLIRMPSGRSIVVDSKAVLDAYLDAEAATDDNTRKAALTRHAQSLRTRIQELSRKAYWEQFQQAPEFVLLFIPGEAFFSAALQEEPNLVEEGFQSRVVLATPTTLMALLKSVAYGWRQEQLAENARRVGEQAARIYQGLAVWSGHLAKIGNSLDGATKAYNNAVGSLERSVLPPVRKMRELGVSTKDEIPELKQVETALRTPALEKLEGEA